VKNVLTWIVKNKLVVALIVAGIILAVLGFIDVGRAIAFGVGAASALVISYFAAGEAPWKD
jgi:Flp pilus assembly protein protease CpaA